jgi:hypothetical protein
MPYGHYAAISAPLPRLPLYAAILFRYYFDAVFRYVTPLPPALPPPAAMMLA